MIIPDGEVGRSTGWVEGSSSMTADCSPIERSITVLLVVDDYSVFAVLVAFDMNFKS